MRASYVLLIINEDDITSYFVVLVVGVLLLDLVGAVMSISYSHVR
jgi:hypothetical protein